MTAASRTCSSLPDIARSQPFSLGISRQSMYLRDMTLLLLCVVARAVPVDDHHGLVSYHPCVVSARQRGDVAGLREQLGSVVHPDRELSAHVVLEMGRFAAAGLCDRLHVLGPPPAGLEHQAPYLAAADRQDLRLAIRELPRLVGCSKALVLGVLHHRPLLVTATGVLI